jgi:hypothetical protein
MSADGIRICADESLRLITKRKLRNSKGLTNKSARGVEIIAGNDDSGLEPMVKGRSLVKALRLMNQQLSDLNGVVAMFLMSQTQYNLFLMTHTHHSPFFAIPVTPSLECVLGGLTNAPQNIMSILDTILQKINLTTAELDSLYQFGNGYICSRYNKVN